MPVIEETMLDDRLHIGVKRSSRTVSRINPSPSNFTENLWRLSVKKWKAIPSRPAVETSQFSTPSHGKKKRD